MGSGGRGGRGGMFEFTGLSRNMGSGEWKVGSGGRGGRGGMGVFVSFKLILPLKGIGAFPLGHTLCPKRQS
ncbi:MAG: hypothetical protein DSM106950_19610 [Stigonema ocellatum SAG 48.90 = DSM 106950]|nr:hypothetical protein [Stigonema ocellatum SAG 48.90 = DSM 106950]